MTIQIRKTYRGINPEMLCDEIRSLAQKQGIIAGEAKLQTYPLLSGSTQSRVTMVFKTKDKKECGSTHIVGSPKGEIKMLLDIDEKLLPQEKTSSLQEDLDFILDSYEVKW